jgi:hypothetical protein
MNSINYNNTYLDSWRSAAVPIDIPLGQIKKVELKTGSGSIVVKPSSFNCELITGYIDKTPPANKQYKKGDKVMFHRDNIIKCISPVYTMKSFKTNCHNTLYD